MLELIKNDIVLLSEESVATSEKTLYDKVNEAYRAKILAQFVPIMESDETSRISALEIALAENWSSVSGTLLCYTAYPDSLIVRLLCHIAKYVGAALTRAPITLLMPGVLTESCHKDYKNLDELEIQDVLNTHILSDSKTYLIPVRLLCELKGPWDTQSEQLNNYYYDYQHSNNEPFINEIELKRLTYHSQDTRGLMESKNEYTSLVTSSGFLGQLKKLIEALKFSSTQGVGSEILAGEGAYLAIIQFNEYYQCLGEKQSDIPEDLKSELDFLVTISSDRNSNDDATGELETCINTRQNNLNHFVEKYECVLIDVDIEENHKSQLLEKLKQQFESNRNHLSNIISEGKYCNGRDIFLLKHDLLEKFNVSPTARENFDVSDFMRLHPLEVDSILKNNASFRNEFISYFSSVDAIEYLFYFSRLETLRVILENIGFSLLHDNLTSVEGICSALAPIVVADQRFEVILQALKNVFSSVMVTLDDFCSLEAYFMDSSQKEMFLNCVMEYLPGLIKYNKDILSIADTLNHQQGETFFELIKDSFPARITSVDLFCYAFSGLRNKEEKQALFESVIDSLSSMISSSDDFNNVVEILNEAQGMALIKRFNNKMPFSVTTLGGVCNLIVNISGEPQKVMLEKYMPVIKGNIGDVMDYAMLSSYLSGELNKLLFSHCKFALSEITLSASDFSFLEGLTQDQRNEFYDLKKDSLSSIVHNGDDFNVVLSFFGEDNQVKLIESCDALLPWVLDNFDDFSSIYKKLTIEAKKSLDDILKNKFPELISSKIEFVDTLESVDRQETVSRENAAEKECSDIELSLENRSDCFTPSYRSWNNDVSSSIEEDTDNSMEASCERFSPPLSD